jgi:hypothetical protein
LGGHPSITMPDNQIGDEVKETPAQPLEEVPQEPTPEPKNEDKETLKKQEQLQNLNTAINLANEELRSIRKNIKEVKTPVQPVEPELPQIDMSDPSSQAWDKHINEKVNPVQQEMEQEKLEIRSFALREFLMDKPLLAGNSEKVKQLISTYESLSKGKISEKTKEGVLTYLDKAYAAENQEELLEMAGQKRVDKAKAESAFSDIAISKGATGYPVQQEPITPLSAEDKAILAKWNMSEEEFQLLLKKQKASKKVG